jgi:hypothetical protein
MNAQFQLGLELTNIFPVREAVLGATGWLYTQVINFARDLRKSGSDLIIEEDLAVIFGRGRIVEDVLQRFKKDILRSTSISPLYHGCDIVLDQGPGPTVRRAIQNTDRYYMSAVIRLSLLGWMHGRAKLASAISECMAVRFRMKLPDAAPDPGFEGILGTLVACSSQTSAFRWSDYVQLVESKIRQNFPGYHHHESFLALTPNLLLACMDYLYLVQSLPESRKITVSSQTGFLTLIIWAHYVLGLSVLLRGVPGGDVLFIGAESTSQVIISWTERRPPNPEVTLLDSQMEVLLHSDPSSTKLDRIDACERLPLKGYGTILLRRHFNTLTTISDSSLLYAESVHMIISMAIKVSVRLVRVPGTSPENRPLGFLIIERWRILAAAALMFNSIEFDNASVSIYTNDITNEESLQSVAFPRAIQNYLQILGLKAESNPVFLRYFTRLAVLLLGLAAVSGIENCAGLPLMGDLGLPENLSFAREAQTKAGNVTVEEKDLFYLISQMLVGSRFLQEENAAGSSVFLVSDFGWSVYVSAVGDNDPADTKPELLYIQKGVPTNPENGERKSRIRDDVSEGWGDLYLPGIKIFDRGESYVPRCLTQVKRRTEYYGSREDGFRLSLGYEIIESYSSSWEDGLHNNYQLHRSYRAFHQGRWSILLAPPCEHMNCESGVTRLGVDAVAGVGLSWSSEGQEEIPERICICLTRGDRHARWLAVESAAMSKVRRTMLRGGQCCDGCAVSAAAELPGKWLVII